MGHNEAGFYEASYMVESVDADARNDIGQRGALVHEEL